jgi:hypothetical protein
VKNKKEHTVKDDFCHFLLLAVCFALGVALASFISVAAHGTVAAFRHVATR